MRDVGDIDEIAELMAVLEDDRAFAVEELGGEDGEDAGVGVGESLARTVDVEEAQGDGGEPVGAADDQAHALLVVFGKSIHGGEVRGLALGGGNRGERIAAMIAKVPVAGFQLGEGAIETGDDPAIDIAVKALAVDTHARSDDEAFDRVIDERFEEDGGALVVRLGISGDLIHALADPDAGGEMIDRVDAIEGAIDGIAIAEIPDHQFDVGGEVVGAFEVFAVDLGKEGIEGNDVVAVLQEFVGDVGANEAGAAGEENSFGHDRERIKIRAIVPPTCGRFRPGTNTGNNADG